MMTLKFSEDVQVPGYPLFKADTVRTVDDTLGQTLINRQQAEKVEEKETSSKSEQRRRAAQQGSKE